MRQFYELDDLKVKIDRASVLKAIDCREDSPAYGEMIKEYEAVLEEVTALIEPVGILGFSRLSEHAAAKDYEKGTPVIYAVTSVGNGVKEYGTKAFQEGDYVRGMICDSIADEALFSLEKRLLERLKELCAEHGVGISGRLEAPLDISMEVQKDAWEVLELKKRFGIEITCGYMYDPVKTSCQVFVLSDNEAQFQADHDCRKCTNFKCRRRNVPKSEITVIQNRKEHLLYTGDGENLMNALLREGYYISAVCGGKGRCGKCRVQVIKGKADITEEDRTVFSEAQLKAGWRLSCMLYPTEDMTIVFALDDETSFEAVGEMSAGNFRAASEVPAGNSGDHAKQKACSSADSCKAADRDTAGKAIAIDVGTTTIALQLLDLGSGSVLETVTFVNSQRKYGADVISRIQASVEGKKEILQECIRQDLRAGIRELLSKAGMEEAKLTEMVIAGNTTMGHLLLGYDCSSLGVYPFDPVNIGFIQGSREEILGRAEQEKNTEVVLLPGISAFVGGDIVSGMYACGIGESDEICMLVDLGTNGEMAIGNKSRILVTSTAAGPAFEGGNITWGMGSVAGAVCSVKLDGAKAHVRTIRDRSPEGICGTGVVEITAELLREEWIDETGVLDEEYFEEGFPVAKTSDGTEIVFTQKDIREVQLAKAAIRAGIETLLVRYGVSEQQVSKLYLAGGFGYRLDKEKAIAIGMFPEKMADKIVAVGNSSLAGAGKYLTDVQAKTKIQQLRQISEEINLSADKNFNEYYMEHMMFE